MAPPNRRPTDPAGSIDLAWRVIALLNIFRLLVPMVLVLVFLFNAPDRSVGTVYPGLFLGICVAYFTFGLVCVQPIQRRWPSVRWMALFPLTVDIVAITLLIHASGGVGSGLANLLFVPVGATSAIVRPRLALMGTAAATLMLLFETTVSALAGITTGSDFLTAGLTGATLFAITLLAVPLARRLRESEALVREREIDIANLNDLNRFIVQHLRESILVVDASDRVRLMNETASRLLSPAPVATGAWLGEFSPRLLALLEAWRRQVHDRRDTTGELVSIDGGTVIRPHFVSLSERGTGPVLVFLEDTSLIAERIQQSKLASLGRLSASIAHEIRNPVGAMSHAGQLLGESPALGDDDRHLTEIIRKNATRVSQIIENVLQLSRREGTRQERLDLAAWLPAVLEEFRTTMRLGPEQFALQAPAEVLDVQFDPTQLHQVLWNLCENAREHGVGQEPPTVRLGRVAATDRPFLEVSDRGPGIRPEDLEHIFEPFFTTRAAGTGLGLFISRELCQTNGAVLSYEPRPGGGSTFRIVFADPQRWAG
jgi:two-component system sensor histidine kinase PilS (NtrC family)